MLSGGWFITASDLLGVLRGFGNGAVLTPELEAEMDGQCLGWDVREPRGGRRKDGGYGDATSGFELSSAAQWPGVPIVLATNSPGTQSLDLVVGTALISATSTQR